MTLEEGGGNWTIDASGKTTYNSKDYGSKYHIKEDPSGVLQRGDGWKSGASSTANRLVWTFAAKTDVVWVRRTYLQLHQGDHVCTCRECVLLHSCSPTSRFHFCIGY